MQLFDTHTHNFESQFLGIKQLELNNEIPNSFYSFGIHPKDTDRYSIDKKELILKLNEICSNKYCIAIGETGIDMRYEHIEIQEDLFIKHLQIAQETSKPIILHTVNSIDRIITLHKKHASDVYMIYHGFNKASALNRLMEYTQLYFSIGESVLTNSNLREAIKLIPNNRLFMETDTSKKELNEIYEEVAKIKFLPLQTLIEEIYENVNRVFKL